MSEVLMESLLWELKGLIFSKHRISDKEPSSCWTPKNLTHVLHKPRSWS